MPGNVGLRVAQPCRVDLPQGNRSIMIIVSCILQVYYRPTSNQLRPTFARLAHLHDGGGS